MFRFLKRDFANNSKLCGLTLETNAKPIGMQNVLRRSTRGMLLIVVEVSHVNAPEASSSKSRMSLFG